MSGTSPVMATRMDRLQNQVTGSILLNVIENTAKLNKKTTSSQSNSSEELKALQTKVNQMSGTVAQASADASAAKSKAEEATSRVGSMQSDVQALQNTVGDDSSGLVREVADVEDNVNSLISVVGSTENDGLRKTVSDLQTTVGDGTNGLVKDIDDLQTAIANVPTTDAVVLKNPSETQTISNNLILSNGKLTIGSRGVYDTLLTVKGNAQFGNLIRLNDSYIRSRSNSGVVFSRYNGSEGLFNYLDINASSDNATLHVKSDTDKIKFHNNIQMVDLDSFTVGESGSPINKISLNATNLTVGNGTDANTNVYGATVVIGNTESNQSNTSKITLRTNGGYIYLNENEFHMGSNDYTLERLTSYSDLYEIKRGTLYLGEESFRTNLYSYGNIYTTNFISNYIQDANMVEMGRLDATEKYGSMLLKYNNGTFDRQNLDTIAIRPSANKVLNINGTVPFTNNFGTTYQLSNASSSTTITDVISSVTAGMTYHFQLWLREIKFSGTAIPAGHDDVESMSTILKINQNGENLATYPVGYKRYYKNNDYALVYADITEGSFIAKTDDPIDITITMSDFHTDWKFNTYVQSFDGYSYDSTVTLNAGNITCDNITVANNISTGNITTTSGNINLGNLSISYDSSLGVITFLDSTLGKSATIILNPN